MFKKIVTAIAILSLVSAVFVSCASAPKEKEDDKPAVSKVIGADGIPMPDWINKVPKSTETFYSVGYSKLANRQMAKTAATQSARDEISRWVGTNVKNALTNYYNESGSGDNTQALSYFENISKQVSDQSLVGSEIEETWVDKEGGVYALVSMPKENVGKSFENVTGEFQRNEAAAFADFKAKEALKFLDEETAK